LRKREIVFALAAGVVAAGGAAALLDSGSSGGGLPNRTIADSRERIYQVAGFDEIATVGPQDVVVTRGDTFSVRAEGSRRALDVLEPVVINGRLTIKPKASTIGPDPPRRHTT
jgi:hypothetical protein